VLQNEDFQELLQYFIEDAGLAPIPANRPRLSFAGNNITEAEPEPCRLERIFNLKNVNALPDGQEIRLVLSLYCSMVITLPANRATLALLDRLGLREVNAKSFRMQLAQTPRRLPRQILRFLTQTQRKSLLGPMASDVLS